MRCDSARMRLQSINLPYSTHTCRPPALLFISNLAPRGAATANGTYLRIEKDLRCDLILWSKARQLRQPLDNTHAQRRLAYRSALHVVAIHLATSYWMIATTHAHDGSTAQLRLGHTVGEVGEVHEVGARLPRRHTQSTTQVSYNMTSYPTVRRYPSTSCASVGTQPGHDNATQWRGNTAFKSVSVAETSRSSPTMTTDMETLVTTHSAGLSSPMHISPPQHYSRVVWAIEINDIASHLPAWSFV
ncbi:hypothetical protein F5Y12DRAFT_226872 [Xylaria sp. FL1777]|nr:hypothetical protein F5Y12DRAFT_226872 [Xylaria sp. FL1777]